MTLLYLRYIDASYCTSAIILVYLRYTMALLHLRYTMALLYLVYTMALLYLGYTMVLLYLRHTVGLLYPGYTSTCAHLYTSLLYISRYTFFIFRVVASANIKEPTTVLVIDLH